MLKDIKSATDKGLKCGILVRTNKDIDNLKKVIYANENSKEYEILNSIAIVFYEYLSYDLTKKSQFFYSILNVPDRFLESSMFSVIPPDFDALLKRPFNMRKKNELSLFSTHLSMLNKCTAIAFCIYLWNVVGLKKYFAEIYPNDKEGINDAFNKITVIAKKCNDKEQFLNQLKTLGKSNEIKQPVNLQLMTYHGSKGLEFDAVFLPDIVEGHVPGRSGILLAGIEEERRLFYVAVTRAKKKLYVYTREDKENHSVLPSRFINELLNKKPSVYDMYPLYWTK